MEYIDIFDYNNKLEKKEGKVNEWFFWSSIKRGLCI